MQPDTKLYIIGKALSDMGKLWVAQTHLFGHVPARLIDDIYDVLETADVSPPIEPLKNSKAPVRGELRVTDH